jgi:hypothetical protein
MHLLTKFKRVWGTEDLVKTGPAITFTVSLSVELPTVFFSDAGVRKVQLADKLNYYCSKLPR